MRLEIIDLRSYLQDGATGSLHSCTLPQINVPDFIHTRQYAWRVWKWIIIVAFLTLHWPTDPLHPFIVRLTDDDATLLYTVYSITECSMIRYLEEHEVCCYCVNEASADWLWKLSMFFFLKMDNVENKIVPPPSLVVYVLFRYVCYKLNTCVNDVKKS